MAEISTFNCRLGSSNPEKYSVSPAELLDLFLGAAEDAHLKGALLSFSVRQKLLTQLIFNIRQHKEALFVLYHQESSLGRPRFEIEFARTLEQIQAYLDAAKNLMENEVESISTNRIIHKKALPLGPIAVFGASNFPLAYSTLGGDVMGALAAGCPVVVKGHSLHAGTSILSANIIKDTISSLNLHPGIFAHVIDNSYNLAHALVQDNRIKGCGFTGSFEGGMALFRLAQMRKNPIPFFAEMGSINPVIFGGDVSDYPQHIHQIVKAITADSGQFCTKPGLVFFPSSKSEQVIEQFLFEMKAAEEHPMLHPSISERYMGRITSIEDSKVNSRHLITGPQFNVTRGFITTNSKSFCEHSAFHDEFFGPFCILVSYENHEELFACLAKLSGQLTGTVIGSSEDFEAFFPTLSLKCGRIIHNGVPTGVSVLPAMHHGGPFPSSTDNRFSAVGEASILRFTRYLSVQKTL